MAAAYVATAAKLDGDSTQLPADIAGQVEGNLREFEGEPPYSKPIGFYTWSDGLSRIFRRDRWCQRLLLFGDRTATGAALLITRAIAEDAELLAAHKGLTQLYAELTNPLSAYTVADILTVVSAEEIARDVPAAVQTVQGAFPAMAGFALLPYSYSREVEWLQVHAGDAAGMMEAFIRAVEEGDIELRPTEQSGWYDYQQYALEPLLFPDRLQEAVKLTLDPEYKKRLRRVFAASITLGRETHVKQAELVGSKAGMELVLNVTVEPPFVCEPLPTLYRRGVGTYDFLAGVLRERLGEGTAGSGAALGELAKPRSDSLLAAVEKARRFERDLYLVACRDLGMEPDLAALGLTGQEAMQVADAMDAWLKDPFADPDMAYDPRVALPIYYDGSTAVCWACIGVSLSMVEAEFTERPTVSVLHAPDDVTLSPEFRTRRAPIADTVFLEFETSGDIPTRAELRAICDREKTPERIAAALREFTGASSVQLGGREVATGPRAVVWVTGAVILVLCAAAIVRILRGRGK